MTALRDYFCAEPAGGEGTWQFVLGDHLYGAFGGIFGGAVAAVSVMTARSLAPGWLAAGIDCRFLRPLRAGAVRARGTRLHRGRTMTVVAVDLHDAQERVVAHSTVSLVDSGALEPINLDGEAPAVAPGGIPWNAPGEAFAPIAEVLHPRMQRARDGGVASTVTIPWEGAATGAEAVCVAADLCVGPPVGSVAQRHPDGAAFPNPDMVLRFAGADSPAVAAARELIGVGRLARCAGGLAAVDIEVWATGSIAAVGAATTLLLRARSR